MTNATGRPLSTALRVSAAGVMYLVTLSATYALFVPPPPASSTAAHEPIAASIALLLVTALNTGLVSWIMLSSSWHGVRLAGTLMLSFFTVATVLPQIDTIIFPIVSNRLLPGTVRGLFAAGFVHAATFIPLAVALLGRWRPRHPDRGTRLMQRRRRDWTLRLSASVVAYVSLYFLFGYYVAWTNDAVRAYYGGTDQGSLVATLRVVLGDTPWLPAVQAGRAALWIAALLPIVAMQSRSRLTTAVTTGLFAAVVMSAALLMPNPYMPFEVRMAHLIETASSNFLFGMLVGWLFSGDSSGQIHNRTAPLEASRLSVQR